MPYTNKISTSIIEDQSQISNFNNFETETNTDLQVLTAL